MSDGTIKLLLEMRPALGGHAGIPQDCRLLFAGLRTMPGLAVEGLLQSSVQRLPDGPQRLGPSEAPVSAASTEVDRASRTVIALSQRLDTRKRLQVWRAAWRERCRARSLSWRSKFGRARIALWQLDSTGFGDFFWQHLFARTLLPSDRTLVDVASFRVCADPWHTLHQAGQRGTKKGGGSYGTLDTRGFDLLLTHTPYPARVHPQTAMVVRYYDALPIWMPHTVADQNRHQSTHFSALRLNAEAGAWFACPSVAAREQLLQIHPQVASRVRVLPCMVSPAFSPATEADDLKAHEIIRSRLQQVEPRWQPVFATSLERNDFYATHLEAPFKFLLVVSTLEARKNHECVLDAWERLRSMEAMRAFKLVFVGAPGWHLDALAPRLRAACERGDLFILHPVPAHELRVLYQQAHLTLCPSRAEGFGLSGVEAMASGGAVIASDLAVHREIYAEAAAYFNPDSAQALAALIARMSDPELGEGRVAGLRQAGVQRAERYRPAVVLPQWVEFLRHVRATHAEPRR